MIKTICFLLVIFFGGLWFVYGGYDDSPGAQLLGFAAVVAGIVGIVKNRKKF